MAGLELWAQLVAGTEGDLSCPPFSFRKDETGPAGGRLANWNPGPTMGKHVFP